MSGARARTLLTGVFCCLSLVAVATQVPRDNPGVRTGTGAIAGVVMTDEITSKPLRHVTVSLTSGELSLPQMTVTDELGRFAFGRLAAGNYTLIASRPGYVAAFYGSKKPGRGPGVPIALLDGQTIGNVAIRLLHGSVITGVVRNASGQPAAGLDVQVMQLQTIDGERRVSASTMAALAALAGGGSTTDDRGVFRVFGLAPGDYLVQTQRGLLASGMAEARQVTASEVQWATRAASMSIAAPGAANTGLPPAPGPGPTVTYATVYYPGTTNVSQAAIVTVGPNEERQGVDFSTQLVPTAKITGTVLGSDGQPFVGSQISMRAIGSAAADLMGLLMGGAGRGSSAADGQFTLNSVTPGRYMLTARATKGVPGPPPGRGAMPDMAEIQAQMGMMTGAGGGAQVWWAQQELTIDGRDVSNITLPLQPGMTVSGKFVFERTTLTPPADLTTARVTIAPPPTGTSPLEFAVAMLSSLAPATTSADGTFAVRGLTPGAYKISVAMPGMLQNPAAPTGGWVLKSVTAGGAGPDIADRVLDVKPGQDISGLVITMSDRPTELSGVVNDQAGRPAPGFPIIIFSTDRNLWAGGSRRVITARPASDGRYRLVGLPAGEYFVAAVTDLDPTQLADPSFLELLALSSFKITLADGEKKTQDLKLGG